MKKDFRRDAKVLIFDIEVSPSLGYYYGKYDTTPIKTVQEPILLALSWKWLGDKSNPKGCTFLDFKQAHRLDDYGIVHKLWELLNECSIAVAYNGDRFDVKMANTFFIRHNMKPPSPYKTYDPLKTAKRYFKFDNNKLDNISHLLVEDGKTETTYKDCWYIMLNGSDFERRKYAKLMNLYCKNDTLILEKVYNKLLPWANNHPNMALHAGQSHICPRCGHDSEFVIGKYRRTGTQVNAIQFRCKTCGGYVTRRLTPEEREELDLTGHLKTEFRNIGA